MMNGWFETLSSVHTTRIWEPLFDTEINTGKFCWRFGPPSESPLSFEVGVPNPRSIPNTPLWKMELLTSRFPTLSPVAT